MDEEDTNIRLANLLRDSLIDDLRPLLWPSRSQLLMRARADAISTRVHGLAWTFGLLTLAFTIVDVLLLPVAPAVELAFARVAATLAFVGIAERTRERNAAMASSYLDLALLFAVPVVFFVATRTVLAGTPLDGTAADYVEVIALAPLVLAAGISLFPLVAIESLVAILVLVALQHWQLQDAAPGRHPGLYWLLALVAAVAAVAGMTQVSLLTAVVTRASHDVLTRCLRRESGAQLLAAQVDFAIRHGTPLSVMFADLDHFKRVNDRFGHEEGDAVLAAAAAALRRALRSSDFVVRWGGEEFLVVLPGTGKAEAAQSYQRMREAGFGAAPDGMPVTLSVGIAELHADRAAGVVGLVELADRRMYAAKQGGRDACVDGSPAVVPVAAAAHG